MLKNRHVEGGSKTLPYRGVCISPFKLQLNFLSGKNRPAFLQTCSFLLIMNYALRILHLLICDAPVDHLVGALTAAGAGIA